MIIGETHVSDELAHVNFDNFTEKYGSWSIHAHQVLFILALEFNIGYQEFKNPGAIMEFDLAMIEVYCSGIIELLRMLIIWEIQKLDKNKYQVSTSI